MTFLSNAQELPLGWIAAGLMLIILMGVSFSLGEDVPAPIPTMAIDEELAPLQSGALEYQDQYADLIVPVVFDGTDYVSGTAP